MNTQILWMLSFPLVCLAAVVYTFIMEGRDQ